MMHLKKKRVGIALPPVLVIVFILLILAFVVKATSAKTVVKTIADIEKIAQGDTALFTMLEGGLCAPLSNVSLKYAIGIGLTGIPHPPDKVSVTYAGISELVNISKCVKSFMKSVNADNYDFYVAYRGTNYYHIPSSGYKSGDPKRTESVYISVPDSDSNVAQVVLNTNLPPLQGTPCPEKDGTYTCLPQAYCTLRGKTCNTKDYLCAGASCCCA